MQDDNGQEIEFPDADKAILENQVFHGERARQIREGEDWKWLMKFIFGAIFDEAVMVLRNSKTDEDRVKAQQMFLACEKPKRQIDYLIHQGDAARISLAQLNGLLNPETTLGSTNGEASNG